MNKPFPILLAEDNEDDIIIIERVWKKNSINNQLCVVRDGEECLEYLRHQGEYSDLKKYPDPGLLLLDLNMPKMGGLETLKEIRNDPVLSRLPVVIMTTSRSDEDRLQSFDLKVNAYVVKPVGFENLIEVVKRIHQFWEIVELPLHLD